MKRRRILPLRGLSVALCLLFLGSADTLCSQVSEEPVEEEAFFESVSVNVVNVDVFVTDKQGNPVTGLTADDFEVTEDKRPVAVTNFYAVEGGRPVAETTVAPKSAVDDAPDAETAVEREFSEQQQLNLVLYVDNFNIRPFNRNRVFRRLREFLRETVEEDDRVMLVTYDRTLKVREPFTNRASTINSALFELEDHSGHAVSVDSDRLQIERTIAEAEEIEEVMRELKPWVESRYNDLNFTIQALSDMVDSLAGLEGRKALVYVSDGLPMRPGEEYFYVLQQQFNYAELLTEVMNYDLSRDFRQLANKANANRVTLYTIDAGGLRTSSQASARYAGGGNNAMSTFADSMYVQNLQSSLRLMADVTGGLAILNTNDVGKHLPKIAADLETYYSLGYIPAHQGDGRLHRIEVSVKDGKGLRVRHRRNYRDKPIQKQMMDATAAALRYGFERNDLGLNLEVGTATLREDGLFLVPVKVEIPIGSLVLVPRADHYIARTKLYFGAIDAEDGLSEISELDLPLQIPEGELETAKKQHWAYTTTLLMLPGSHQVAVGLRDELGANTSYVKQAFYVGGT